MILLTLIHFQPSEPRRREGLPLNLCRVPRETKGVARLVQYLTLACTWMMLTVKWSSNKSQRYLTTLNSPFLSIERKRVRSKQFRFPKFCSERSKPTRSRVSNSYGRTSARIFFHQAGLQRRCHKHSCLHHHQTHIINHLQHQYRRTCYLLHHQIHFISHVHFINHLIHFTNHPMHFIQHLMLFTNPHLCLKSKMAPIKRYGVAYLRIIWVLVKVYRWLLCFTLSLLTRC
mmetsp:Transcript_31632/g.46136  ORF Transcript_31632/g.46136 Transcript_31632/m.46136 type:complete len:230 (+) Transcript_31632:496-1185(+)